MSPTSKFAWVAFSLLVLSHSLASVSATLYNKTCHRIAHALSSSSQVYYPGSSGYSTDISHWATSSAQQAACSVEPGTARDVGVILQILGSTRTPFAVKGGGHASNPGFSSTEGVQIAMYRFSEVTYDSSTQTATIGAGLIWDDVYSALAPHNVNVVGGRTSGVGVAGFTLGGGYSWKTNQYGLTLDTVQAFELVLPNGIVTNVTAKSNPDLFFGLKGGFNNFGVVTKFVLKTFPQTQVWGGIIVYAPNVLDDANAAIYKFSANNTDPKAAMIATYNFYMGQLTVSALIFYDAPTPPAGLFEDFLAITSVEKNISTRSFESLVQVSGSTGGLRGVFDTVSLTDYTPDLLQSIVNQTNFYGNSLANDSGTFISYDVEPFLPSLFSHNPAPTAYPPIRSKPLLPLNLYFAWTNPLFDEAIQKAIRESAALIKAQAVAGGQDVADAAVYGNYAIFDTPVENIYGRHLPRLKRIREAYDPRGVMGLAGGFKF